MYGGDFDEVIPPEVSSYGDFGGARDLVARLKPTMAEFKDALFAGTGVATGLAAGKAVEKFSATTLKLGSKVTPFAQVGVGLIAGRAVAFWHAPFGAGLAGGMIGLGIANAAKQFLGVNLLQGIGDNLESADLSELADLLAAGGGDSLLPPELQALDQVVVEQQAVSQIPEDVQGMGLPWGQVTVEQQAMAGWSYG